RVLRTDPEQHRSERTRAAADALSRQRTTAMDCILAIDQGTSATKCVLVDRGGGIVAKAVAPLTERYPHPGWVEQDAEEIWSSVLGAVGQCLAQRMDARVAAVGLSTQRESALVWRKSDGQSITPLLSWQDQRTIELRDRLAAEG